MKMVRLYYIPLDRKKMSWDFFMFVEILEQAILLPLYQPMPYRYKFWGAITDIIILLEDVVDSTQGDQDIAKDSTGVEIVS